MSPKLLAETDWKIQCVDWTARLLVAAYFLRLLADARRASYSTRPTQNGNRQTEQLALLARLAWTIGAVLSVIHVALAMGLIHDWSLSAAEQHTAEQTEQVIGRRFGIGVYVNFLFTCFWCVDSAWWWTHGVDWAYRSASRYWATQALFAFIFFNATVVFGPWWWTPVAAGAMLSLLAARFWHLARPEQLAKK